MLDILQLQKTNQFIFTILTLVKNLIYLIFIQKKKKNKK
jgi:hypothetical protein